MNLVEILRGIFLVVVELYQKIAVDAFIQGYIRVQNMRSGGDIMLLYRMCVYLSSQP